MPELTTAFAPAERSRPDEIRIHAQYFADAWFFGELLHYVPDMVLILNRHRQIIYANRTVLQFVKAPDLPAVLGLRPGELFGCRHSHETEGGCGTTLFCRYCGAVKAVLDSQAGRFAVEECRLTIVGPRGEEALDLRVWASPMKLRDEPFTFFAVADIADEKRRYFLENIFLHDIMNTATALKGFSWMLRTGVGQTESEAYIQRIATLSDWIIEEIEAHRQLMAAESGELEIGIERVGSRGLLEAVLAAHQRPDLLNGRRLCIAEESADAELETDPSLLRRVLGNMVKNAIEGSAPGEVVTMACRLGRGSVVFTVHNPTYIPENIRLQMFSRSFSTKGAGRGLGTYSMKFLSERYLAGKISYTSTEADGTTFAAEYPLRHPG